MFQKVVRVLGGDPNRRDIEKYTDRAEEINALEPEYEKLTDEELRGKTDEFRARLAEGETLDDLLNEAFAVVREASKRTIGLRHYEVQLIGGMVLNNTQSPRCAPAKARPGGNPAALPQRPDGTRRAPGDRQ